MENQKQKQNAAKETRLAHAIHHGLGLAFFVLLFVTTVVYVSASTVTSRRDNMSDQTVSATASHQIQFTFSGTNNWVAGENVIIDFHQSGSSFTVNGASFTTSDINVNDGANRGAPFSVSVGAANCTGSSGANAYAVGINNVTGVFTFLACPTWGASGTGAAVTISLGSAAGGTNRIANPPTSGNYTIDITDAAGDCSGSSCGIGVAIVNSDQTTVTATVAGGGGGGGGGGSGTPPPPPPAPVISNITVTNITTSSATIGWNTDQGTNSLVNYGLSPSYGANASDAAFVTTHTINLSNLTDSTLYHFQVCSTNSTHSQTCSADQTFTTLDGTPPVISNVTVTNITTNSATVSWSTNENSSSFVDYATVAGPPYALTNGAPTPLVTSHSVNLTGLSAATLYHFRVRSGDASGNEAFTSDATFTTLTTPVGGVGPVISNIAVTAITESSAVITWDTDVAASSFVDYSTALPYSSVAGAASPLVTSHSVTLTGLNEATTYVYRVRSADASGSTNGPDSSFATIDNIAPVISNFHIAQISTTSAHAVWTTDEPSSSSVTLTAGPTFNDAAMVTNHDLPMTGLTPNTTYHATATSVDPASNSTSSGPIDFTTLSPVPPVISAIDVNHITTTTASVTWDTDVPADSVVDYGLTTAYGATASVATLVTSHVVNLSGLTSSTLYHFRVHSTNAAALEAVSGDGTFTTLTVVTPPSNVTSLTAYPGDQQVTLAWNNPTDPSFVATTLVRKLGSYPVDVNDGAKIYDGSGTGYLDVGLTNGTTYYYGAFAHDATPVYASGALANATPSGPGGIPVPAPAINLTATPGNTTVLVSWTNPSDPNWAGSRLVRKLGSFPADPLDGTLVVRGQIDHILDTGLTNGTTYYYGVFAYNAAIQYSAGAFGSATPLGTLPPPPAPTCSDTDGGRNYGVAGTVTAGGTSASDFCINSSTLDEQYCSGGAATSEIYDCGTGNQCVSGRCLPVSAVVTPTPPVAKPPTPPVKPTPPATSQLSPQYIDAASNITLRTFGGNIVQAYVSRGINVLIPNGSTAQPVTSAKITFNGAQYQMQSTSAGFRGNIPVPGTPTDYPLTVDAILADNSTATGSGTIRAVALPIAYETKNGAQSPLNGARVSLFVQFPGNQFGLWDGSPYHESNPVVVGPSGNYQFTLPPGTYELIADNDGYATDQSLPFSVQSENVVTQSIELIAQPAPILVSLPPIINSGAPLPVKVQQIGEVARDQYIYAAALIAAGTRDIRTNKITQKQIKGVAVPILVTAAAVNVVAGGFLAATAIPYLLYLLSLLSHPLLLIAPWRRKKWGTVYNSLSKLPVDLAIVRVLDDRTGKIVRSSVTDKDGRYFFIVPAGDYRLAVAKANYIFPSALVKEQDQDILFVDVYHTERISVKERSAITANIPIDPIGDEKRPWRIVLEGIARRAQNTLGILSILAMGVACYLTPQPWVFGLLAANVVFYAVFRRLAISARPKSWGIVRDKDNHHALENTVVRIFDTKYNKLLETQVTDIRGRYSFLVGSNVYNVTFEKPGYSKQQKGPVDLTEATKNKEKFVAVDVAMPKAKGVQPSTPPPAEKPPEPPPAPPAAPTPAPITPSPQPPASPSPDKKDAPWELKMLEELKKRDPGQGK